MNGKIVDDSIQKSPNSPKRLISKGSADADLSPGMRRAATHRLGTLQLDTNLESNSVAQEVLVRVDRRPSPTGGPSVPMSILKNSKNSSTNNQQYARAKGGKFAAIYKELIRVQNAGDVAQQMRSENEETLQFIKQMKLQAWKNERSCGQRKESNSFSKSPRAQSPIRKRQITADLSQQPPQLPQPKLEVIKVKRKPQRSPTDKINKLNLDKVFAKNATTEPHTNIGSINHSPRKWEPIETSSSYGAKKLRSPLAL